MIQTFTLALNSDQCQCLDAGEDEKQLRISCCVDWSKHLKAFSFTSTQLSRDTHAHNSKVFSVTWTNQSKDTNTVQSSLARNLTISFCIGRLCFAVGGLGKTISFCIGRLCLAVGGLVKMGMN